MNSLVYCKECKTKDDCVYSSGLRCHKHQILIDQQSSGLGSAIYPTRPKSDMEIIFEKLEKIELRLEALEKGND